MKAIANIWTEWPFVIGLIGSFLVMFLFFLSLTYPVEVGAEIYSTKWHYLRNAPPNEIGDTIAGAAGSLAFIWLVVAVLLQAKELRDQRHEFSKMAISQQEQASHLERQISLIEAQQNRLREEHNLKAIGNFAAFIISQVQNATFLTTDWVWLDYDDMDDSARGEKRPKVRRSNIFVLSSTERENLNSQNLSNTAKMKTLTEALRLGNNQAVTKTVENKVRDKPRRLETHDEMARVCEKIRDIYAEGSVSELAAIRSYELQFFSEIYLSLYQRDRCWDLE